ncbi:hypothetical protein BH11MYX2_BH11MYX2_19360 [soil metagenome]
MASGEKPSSGNVSGVGETLPAGSIQDTLPAQPSEISQSGQPADRPSRASIPLLPTSRYRIGEEIGRGGMGRVVEAFDTQLGRTVALKEVLPDGATIIRRFVREIEITARLEHASIVPLYDSGTTPDGRPFYVMRRVTGRPLDEEIRRAHSLDDRLMLLPSMLAAIDAIAHAHARGVIHRDLKPANILVGELGQTVVIDWGLAKVIGEVDEEMSTSTPQTTDSLHTQIGSVFGTPGFMSPEQARGEELTPTVDVYALGATLYQLLAGKPPLGGSSATELIGKTLIHDVTPLAHVVEGVPRELNAIVEKALSFDAAVRYKDASELAADVRRFQAGQLVAAHNYTRRQRVTRFMSKNRSPLAVAAVALVAVAAFGLFSVHRVLVERDAASDARAQALKEKQAAETARDRLAERNDELVIARARSVLDSNPTLAAAIVADLPATSRRAGDARAVAQAAIARGVWTGFAGPVGATARAELDARGERLLTLGVEGTLRVWDLDHGRLVLARQYSNRVVGWAGSLIAVYGQGAPLELLDPAANRATPLPGAPIAELSIAADGVTAAGVDADGAAVLMDLRTGTRTPVWPGHVANEIEISEDGTWMLVRDKELAAAIQRDGTVLSTKPHDGSANVKMGGRRAALFGTAGPLILELDPAPTWTRVELPADVKGVFSGEWRAGGRLDFLGYPLRVYTWTQKHGVYAQPIAFDTVVGPTQTMGDDWFVVLTNKDVVVLAGAAELRLPIPVATSRKRVITRHGSTRAVIVSDGSILLIDLADVCPTMVAFVAEGGAMASADTAIQALPPGNGVWIDIATRAKTPIGLDVPVEIASWDTTTKRVLARTIGIKPPRIYWGKVGLPAFVPVVRGDNAWALLVSPDSVMFGSGENGDRIAVRDHQEGPRELATLTARVTGMTVDGPNRAVLLTESGELLRVDTTRGILERTSISASEQTMISSVGDDRVAIADGVHLSVWRRGAVSEVTQFGKPIVQVIALADATAIVVLDDQSSWRVQIEPGAKPTPLLPTTFNLVTEPSGQRAAALVTNMDVEIVDLPSSSRWTLPHFMDGNAAVHIQLMSSTVLARYDSSSVSLWTLPTADADLANWIHEHTNARVNGDDLLVWPWQTVAP